MTNFLQIISEEKKTIEFEEERERERERENEAADSFKFINTMHICSYVPFNYHIVRLPLA